MPEQGMLQPPQWVTFVVVSTQVPEHHDSVPQFWIAADSLDDVTSSRYASG